MGCVCACMCVFVCVCVRERENLLLCDLLGGREANRTTHTAAAARYPSLVSGIRERR